MADDELTPSTDEPSDDQTNKDWEAEATKWKALARKHEKAAKDNADAARRLAEIEESGKSEQERLAEARRASDERATAAERDAARLRVPLRKGLTDVQARRLVGDTVALGGVGTIITGSPTVLIRGNRERSTHRGGDVYSPAPLPCPHSSGSL